MTERRPAQISFADDLGRHGVKPALITEDSVVTYADLEARVEERRRELGTTRRLVACAARNSVESIVSYLSALRSGLPAMLVAPQGLEASGGLLDVYDPDLVIDGAALHERHAPAHELHPDLALLLSTSGSTGTPKLVRLSYANLQANAASIAQSLHLASSDRAMTALPMQYCYGLSVLNSHLHVGAALVLTELSVLDACFWDLFRRAGATSFAGVPHTFDLLDRIGFDDMELPSLRYVTQAGGRLPPDAVRRYARLGTERGWELFVMYGQTEATARMAVLPPALAERRPESIGAPIPGGALTIEDPDHEGVGELVYCGPNVMLGYAEAACDLAKGREVDALRTGDLARRGVDGLFEIVGRRSRFLKPFGVRVDLDDLERLLAANGIAAACTGDDARLVVGVDHHADVDAVSALLDASLGLPRSHLLVVRLDALPFLSSGKLDYPAVRAAASASAAAEPPGPSGDGDVVRVIFGDVLGVTAGDDDSFVSLGGDSLSFVEVSVRLEAVLGDLPRDWHEQPLRVLASAGSPRRRRLWAMLDTSVVLRAVAIILIVGTHVDLWEQPGGAHALLAVAGFNFARFQVRGSHRWAGLARIAVPSACWIALVVVVSDQYRWPHAVFLNDVLGDPGAPWAFWFAESLVQILLVMTLVLAVPAVARAERRRPFLFAAGAVVVGLLLRSDALGPALADNRIFYPQEVFWLFALGWAAARAQRWPERAVVTAAALVGIQGFFGDPAREAVVMAAVALVVWVPRLPVPRPLVPPMTIVAEASLAIYLTHMPVHLPLKRTYGPVVALAGSVLFGVVAWRVAGRVGAAASRAVDLLSQRRAGGVRESERPRAGNGRQAHAVTDRVHLE